MWPAYVPPARRRRTVPLIFGGTVVLLVVAAVVGLVLTAHRPAPPTAAAPPPPVPSAVASASTAPSASAAFTVGDCLTVTSTTADRFDNARLTRQDCAGPYFAAVLARVAGAADCPTDTLSRIGDAGQVLCLGQGARGAMARPGDCVRVPTGFQLPLIRTDCAGATKPFRLEAVVDDPARCPTGTQGAPYSGYDRPLCIRFPQ